MAKKKNTLLVCQFRPAGLKFVKKYKSLAVEGGRDDYIVWMTAQNTFFFSCLVPAHQVIKKFKMDHLWVYTLYPPSCTNSYRM